MRLEGGNGLLLVSFQERPSPPAERAPRGKAGGRSKDPHRNAELERALADSREILRTTIEEQQASTEELKSTNEELQSTNEELQSTNEELETSKEELQSVNEELVTVNAELQAKIEQLAGMQNDMSNLLDSVNVGTIFLDTQLAIRRFTREATKIFRLVADRRGSPAPRHQDRPRRGRTSSAPRKACSTPCCPGSGRSTPAEATRTWSASSPTGRWRTSSTAW